MSEETKPKRRKYAKKVKANIVDDSKEVKEVAKEETKEVYHAVEEAVDTMQIDAEAVDTMQIDAEAVDTMQIDAEAVDTIQIDAEAMQVDTKDTIEEEEKIPFASLGPLPTESKPLISPYLDIKPSRTLKDIESDVDLLHTQIAHMRETVTQLFIEGKKPSKTGFAAFYERSNVHF